MYCKLSIMGALLYCIVLPEALKPSMADQFKAHVIDYIVKYDQENKSKEGDLKKLFQELDAPERFSVCSELKFIAEASIDALHYSDECLCPSLLRPDGKGRICHTRESSLRLLNFLENIEGCPISSLEASRFKIELSDYLSKNKDDKSIEDKLAEAFNNLEKSEKILIYDGLMFIAASCLDELDTLKDCCVDPDCLSHEPALPAERGVQHELATRLLNFLEKIEHCCSGAQLI